MSHSLDELYLNWLYELVADAQQARPSKTFWKLISHLYGKPFVWIVPNDDNRIDDGLHLREEFIEDLGLDIEDSDWLHLECSMLELLIGLARRLSFLDGGEPALWFWQLIANLGLRFPDHRRFPSDYAEEVLDDVILRTYEPSGVGGLFPLVRPDRDQRDAELWYQLNAYLLELD